MDSGSTQHSRRAQGEMRSTSGGSTPMLRHSASATAVVLVRSFWRQRETGGAPGVSEGVARRFAPAEEGFAEVEAAAEVSWRACFLFEEKKRRKEEEVENERVFFLAWFFYALASP